MMAVGEELLQPAGCERDGVRVGDPDDVEACAPGIGDEAGLQRRGGCGGA